MNSLVEKTITCPMCWEAIDILVDTSVAAQSYIEDCQVCCHPIELQLRIQGEAVDIEKVTLA